MRRRVVGVLLLAAVAGCSSMVAQLPPPGSRWSVGPRHDRYETIVAAPPRAIYNAALRVLTDSSFTPTAASNPEAGIIQTEYRDPNRVKSGMSLLLNLTMPIRLFIAIVPVGTDSARFTIRGEANDPGISGVRPIEPGHKGEWQMMTGVGNAIVAAAEEQGHATAR